MKCVHAAIPDVVVIEPRVFKDSRGFFFESFNEHEFCKAVDASVAFVQHNHSHSTQGMLRGLHYQIECAQGNLVRVVSRAVFDVAVDIRRSSSSFGQWVGCELSAETKRQLWIPPGFAHGVLVLSASTDLLYKTTDFYAPEFERTIAWNDPSIGIDWPIEDEPILSNKDAAGALLEDAEVFD
jgi:dTDP-4-dehydrorhamnose 3,5-epimerase